MQKKKSVKTKPAAKTIKLTGSRAARMKQAGKLFPCLTYTNGFGEWLHKECLENGKKVLTPKQVKNIFGADAENNADRFAREKGLNFYVNEQTGSFKFELVESGDLDIVNN